MKLFELRTEVEPGFVGAYVVLAMDAEAARKRMERGWLGRTASCPSPRSATTLRSCGWRTRRPTNPTPATHPAESGASRAGEETATSRPAP